ncbi:MAG: hypothetical protein EXS10_02050 [Phycisphaerales bacterium]|nr:hypothetical protein [Phycisphaerales bacterium]
MNAARSSKIWLLALLFASSGCGISPWEQNSNDPSASDEIEEVIFACDDARFGEFQDVRESSLVMHHGKLHINHPSSRTAPTGGRSCVLVRTTSGVLAQKIRDVLDGKYPINTGFEAMFALGRTALVKIERVDGDGKVLSTEEARAAFLEIVR